MSLAGSLFLKGTQIPQIQFCEISHGHYSYVLSKYNMLGPLEGITEPFFGVLNDLAHVYILLKISFLKDINSIECLLIDLKLVCSC